MDWIRQSRTVPMRLWRDSDETTLVQWFPCDQGARDYPGPHNFARWNEWREHGHRCDDLRWEPPPPIGELDGDRGTYLPNRMPAPYLGQQACGRPEAFVTGAVHGVDPPMPVLPNGTVACCALAVSAGTTLLFGAGDLLSRAATIHLDQTVQVATHDVYIGLREPMRLGQSVLISVVSPTSAVEPLALGQLVQVATRQPVAITESLALGQLVQVATRQPVPTVEPLKLGQLVQVATALPVGIVQPFALGQLVQVATHQGSVIAQPMRLGQIVTALARFPWQPRGQFGLGQLVKVATALPVAASQPFALGQTVTAFARTKVAIAEPMKLGQTVTAFARTKVAIAEPMKLGQTVTVATVTGSTFPAIAGSSTFTTTGVTFSGANPVFGVSGKTLLWFITSNQLSGGPGIPAGWTRLSSTTFSFGNFGYDVLTKLSSGSDPANFTIATGSNWSGSGVMVALSSTSGTTQAGATNATAGTPAVALPITTVGANHRVIACWGLDLATHTPTIPVGWTAIATASSVTKTVTAYKDFAVGGSTGNASCAYTIVGASCSSQVGVSP